MTNENTDYEVVRTQLALAQKSLVKALYALPVYSQDYLDLLEVASRIADLKESY